ncbi:MAG: cyclic nucleotide-binding domain-containing protein, partial [Gammaproteobacteria bacterium]|nr:cyclic nucleotide-binding domain-containing protein [Gammaproteobacteria bacterium]
MEHAGSSITDLVTGIVLLLLIAAVTTMFSKKVDKLPLTVLLVFVGIAISHFGHDTPGLSLLSQFQLTPELVLFVFIPTLIFESAFNLNARQLSNNLWPILTLAIPGLLISTCIIGFIFSVFTEFDLMVGLLLGAILSATDPVAVIAIFKQLGVPERLTILVEGESLFNDATSLVLATILIGLLTAGEFSSDVLVSGTGEFLLVFAGGVIVGWVLALITGNMLGRIESDPGIEITLTTILAYFSFIIAEHVFHVSGIMAVVAAGMTIGSWGKSKISPSTSAFMEHFWEYLAFVANALIFLMVGLQIDLVVLWESVDLIALVVVAMLISRAIVIYSVVPLIGRMPGAEPIGMPFQSVMYWGGLRGAIALAIVLALPPFYYKDTLISLVMGAVLFTLVVQGLSIEKLVKFLGLDALSISDSLAKLEGDKNARVEGLKRLNSLVSGGLFSQRIADNLREKSEQSLSELGAEIETLNSNMTKEEMATILAMRCLAREKSRFYELFSHGLINESAYRELEHTIAVQFDEVRHRGLMPTVKAEKSIGKTVFEAVTNMFEVAGARALAERLSTSSIIRDYDVAWGRYRAANSVLNGLDAIASEGNIDTVTTGNMREVYEEILRAAKAQIDEVAEQYPEFVETIQEQLGQRLLLVAEHASVEQAAEMGMINEGIAHTILKNQASRIRQLNQENMSACFEIEVTEILKKVPMFQGVSEAEHAFIGGYLRTKTVPRGKVIIRQGSAGDSIFLIARGIANVEVTEGDAVSHVATLYAGDFFGEAALLHGTPRNATTIAATPCSLYELNRQDLDRICEQHPKIRQMVEEVDRERVALGT